MTIPLDRLYHYILDQAEQIHGEPVDLLRFYPHGSKDIKDLGSIQNIPGYQKFISPMIFCYDQEPLDFARYQDVEHDDKYNLYYKKYNLQKYNFQSNRQNIYDKSILLHSEQRSENLQKYYDNWFIPSYYWSHALISLDWFRFAQHQQQKKKSNKIFLIYNRAWSNTREYRLRFLELLVESNLHDHCLASCNPIDSELGTHYSFHKFKDSKWKPNMVLEYYFPINSAPSHSSADFDLEDYQQTDIEVVLETMFDDDRLWLTEKSLRPMACAQPFILAATHGSLKLLRDYGFQTFAHIWDEKYDLILDPEQRLLQISSLMKQISNWTPEQRAKKIAQARVVADYNKRHFFSQDFFQRVIGELRDNLAAALAKLESTNTSKIWIQRRKRLWQIPEYRNSWYDFGPNSYWPGRTRQDIMQVLKRARLYYNRA